MKKIIKFWVTISLVLSFSLVPLRVFADNTEIQPSEPVSTEPQDLVVDNPTKVPDLVPVLEEQPTPVLPEIPKDIVLPTPGIPSEILSPTLEDQNPEKKPDDVVEDDIKDQEPQPETPTTIGESGPNPNPNQVNQAIVPKVNQSTGAATQSFSFLVPPGRNNFEPEVSLSYNSQNTDELAPVGYGWSINIPYIERSSKQGVTGMYERDEFISSASGELINDANIYKPRIERGDFLSYEKVGQSWKAVDKSGKIYEYGLTASSLFANPDDASQVGRWMLSKVTDSNGNYIDYSYSQIPFEGFSYLSAIHYGHNSEGSSAFQISFDYSPRKDVIPNGSSGSGWSISYKYGWRLVLSKTLTSVNVSVVMSDTQDYQRLYNLGYIAGVDSKRPLLSEIEEFSYNSGGTRIALPKTRFEYQGQSVSERTWQKQDSWSMPTIDQSGFTTRQTSFDSGTRVADVNGDGLPDMLTRKTDLNWDQLNKTQVWLNSGSGFVRNLSWSMPQISLGSICPSTPIYELSFDGQNGRPGGLWLQDVNGDQLPDLIAKYSLTCFADNSGTIIEGVWINSGSGWTKNSSWQIPEEVLTAMGYTQSDFDTGARLADVSGDSLPDLILSRASKSGRDTISELGVWLNTGSTWQATTKFTIPMVKGCKYSDGEYEIVPLLFRNYFSLRSTGNYIADVNGDGLGDFVAVSSSCHNINQIEGGLTDGPGIYLNTGTTFERVTSMESSLLKQTQLGDVNGDNKLDLVWGNIREDSSGGTENAVLAHDGDFMRTVGGPWPYTGIPYPYASTIPWQFPTELNCDNQPVAVSFQNLFVLTQAYQRFAAGDTISTGLQLMDINGDGMPDLFNFNHEAPCFRFDQQGRPIYGNRQSGVWFNTAKRPDVLTKIIYPTGGNTQIVYKSALQETIGGVKQNPLLPFSQLVVSTITTSDGAGLSGTTNYSYSGGSYYYNPTNIFDKTSAGFALVTSTSPDGGVSKTFFHQGNGSSAGEPTDSFAKIGSIYRQEVWNAQNQKMTDSFSFYNESALTLNRTKILIDNSVSRDFDGNVSHKDKAQTYTYDSAGNIIESKDFGEVIASDSGSFSDVLSDSITQSFTYAEKSGQLTTFVSSQTIRDHSGTQKAQTKYFYDNLGFGLIAQGNNTSQEKWISDSEVSNTSQSFNSFGQVLTSTDPRGKLTSLVYDSYNIHPIRVTNALGHQVNTIYDYSSGQAKEVTNPNGAKQRTTFDVFDRPTLIEKTDPQTTQYRANKEINYIDTPGQVAVFETDNLTTNQSQKTFSATIFDGLGRPIKKYAWLNSQNNSYVVSQTVYDSSGRISKQSIPVASTSPDPVIQSSQNINKSYDVLGRVINEINVLGTTTYLYDNWQKIVTNANGKATDYQFDAQEKLVSVVEHNQGQNYLTAYQYDALGNLTKLTDSLGNIRNFTFDGLSRRLSSEDLHSSQDESFGVYSYTYDVSGNLISRTDPKNQTVNYSYDDINRVLSEDFTDTQEIEVSYGYDSCFKGIGQLCSSTTLSGSVSYDYDNHGNLVKEVNIIDGIPYQTLYAYDIAGNLIEYQNPDNSKVKYTFGDFGKIISVSRKESIDPAFVPVVSNIVYAPNGQITSMSFANGVITTSTYDSQKLNRLTRKLTLNSLSLKLQDLFYTYDSVGNITKIIDNSQTNSKKTVDYIYDDLDRLISATSSGASGGGSNYLQNYQYNQIGNLITKTDSGDYGYDTDFRTYANPHAPITIGSFEYQYDRNGNVTSVQDLSLRPIPNGAGNNWENIWDYNNRLVESVVDKKQNSFQYDHAGRRIKMQNDRQINIYPTENYNLENGSAVKHIMLGDDMLATIKGIGVAAQAFLIHTDHLTGSNVVTNSLGQVTELLDYYPYGSIRLDEKVGEFSEQRKFAGHELDDATGFTYMQARYYNGITGRFLSQDPVFWEMPKEYLLDPQQQNSYSYARNNPINRTDPDGRLNLIIPGTGYDPNGWSKDSAAKDLYNNVNSTFSSGQATFILNIKSLWSGDDNKKARADAAENISSIINRHKFKDGETLNIVAHSHGGNVAALLSNKIIKDIDNLVTLGTPIRNDYSFNQAKIKNHINVYSESDVIQTLGGGGLSVPSVALGCFILCKNTGGFLGWGEFGIAKRTIKSAENINVTEQTKNVGARSHSLLWQSDKVWGRVKDKLSR